MLSPLARFAPDIFYRPSTFAMAFRTSLAALTLVQTDIVFESLELARIVLTHDCLSPTLSQPPPPKFPVYAAVIKGVIDKQGFEFVGYLLTGLVGDFPEDATTIVVSVFRALSATWSSQLLSWLPPVLQQLPTSSVSNQTKTDFLSEVTRFVPLYAFSCIHLNLFCHDIHAARSMRDNMTK
jgi:transportin-3